MAVKVLIRRSVQKNKSEQVFELLKRLRREAINQPGYISGETLVNHYNPQNMVVISIWQTIEDWINWQGSGERVEIDTKLEKLLEEPAQSEIYDLGLLSKNKEFLI